MSLTSSKERINKHSVSTIHTLELALKNLKPPLLLMAKLHIGKKINEVWRKSRLKGTEFAAAINRDRQVIYDIFKRESIDTELLQQISKVLNHDFFSYYSSDTTLVKEPKDKFGYATKDELAQANRELVAFMKSEFAKLREELSLKKEGYRVKSKKSLKK